jgi:hypothetical protein
VAYATPLPKALYALVMDKDLKQYGQWLGGEKLEGIKFLHNCFVEVVCGKHKGNTGSVVSIYKYPPIQDVLYVVETESEGDVQVKESEIVSRDVRSGI